MPIEMPKGLPFSVDTWTQSSKKKRHHFLTHAHKDHCDGLSTHFSYPIYASNLTKTLVLQLYPQLDELLFACIEVGESRTISDPDGAFSVTALDANHCPGALMFLFDGSFGNILHTGDCRLVSTCLQSLPLKYIGKKGRHQKCQLDYIFLDCTFGKFPFKIPSKNSAVQQVINCIWKHPDAAIVYLACDGLGQEEILKHVSETFGSKIYVDKAIRSECLQALALTFPEIISDNPCCRFHLFEGFPKLHERAKSKFVEAAANRWPKPLIIRPSVQWYACKEVPEVKIRGKQRLNEAVMDEFGVWHVCYSMHSSREELEWALELLSPKWVVSTTPDCLAIELDYVKTHCLTSKIAYDSTLMKLLDIHIEFPKEVPKDHHHSSTPESQHLELGGLCKIPVLCYESEKRSLTLFGRARNGHPDFMSERDGKNNLSKKDGTAHNLQTASQKLECEESSLSQGENDQGSEREGKMRDVTGDENVEVESNSSMGSEGFTASFKKAYRSMNVPVPRPLPSLVELMGSKRSWRIYDL